MPKYLKILSFNLEVLRNKEGLSQIEFAKKVKITPTYYNQLKACTNRNPSLEKLDRIAHYCGVSLKDLFSDTDAPPHSTMDIFAVAKKIAEELDRKKS